MYNLASFSHKYMKLSYVHNQTETFKNVHYNTLPTGKNGNKLHFHQQKNGQIMAYWNKKYYTNR